MGKLESRQISLCERAARSAGDVGLTAEDATAMFLKDFRYSKEGHDCWRAISRRETGAVLALITPARFHNFRETAGLLDNLSAAVIQGRTIDQVHAHPEHRPGESTASRYHRIGRAVWSMHRPDQGELVDLFRSCQGHDPNEIFCYSSGELTVLKDQFSAHKVNRAPREWLQERQFEQGDLYAMLAWSKAQVLLNPVRWQRYADLGAAVTARIDELTSPGLSGTRGSAKRELPRGRRLG